MHLTNWKLVLGILTGIVFIMSSSYTMIIPFLPLFLLHDLGVPQKDVTMWTGAIFSITFLISTFLAPIWGRLTDTKGKKIMALRASISLAVSYFVGALVQTPLQLFGMRILQGFAAGLWAVCVVICTSLVPSDKLGFGLGILQAGQTAGQAAGPLMGGAMATFLGIRKSFFFAGVAYVIITLIFIFLIPEPKSAPTPKEKVKPTVNLLRQPLIIEILLYGCLIKIVTLLIQPILLLYVTNLEPDAPNIMFYAGLVFSLIGIASAITAPWWGTLGQKRGFYKVLALSCISAGFASAACAWPRTIFSFGVMNFIYGLLFAGTIPALNALLTRAVDEKHRGLAFGYQFSSDKFGSMLGPLLGGAIAAYFPMSGVFYASGLMLLFIGLIVYLQHIRKA